MINLMSRIFIILALFTSLFAQAQAFGPQLTYHGRILDTAAANAPVTGNVTFLMQIVHPDVPTCVLYQETQTQNLTAADGNFTLTVNGGSSTLPAALLNPFSDVFITDATRSINCINGGTVPGSVNSRRLNVYFIPPGGGTVYEPLPSQAINYVPLAIEALNTNAVGGFGAPSLLRVVEINGFGVPVPYAVPAITRPLYEELDNTIKGQSSYYVTSQGTVAYFSVPLSGEVTGPQSATVVSRIMGRNVNPAGGTYVGGEVMYFDGAAWIAKPGIAGTVKSVTSTNNYLTVTGGPPSNDPTIDPLLTVNVGTVANTVAAGNDPRIVNAVQTTTALGGDVTGVISATVVATVGGRTASAIATSVGDTIAATSALVNGTLVKRDGSGNVTVNTISSTNNSTRNILLYNAANTQNATINVPAALAVSYTLTLPGTMPVSGFVLATDANGITSWISPTTGNVTNVSATAPLVSTGGQTPTISIPQANYITDGFLSAISFTNFSNKVASITVTAPLTIAGTSMTPQLGLQDSGVTAGTYTKFTVDSKGIITSGTSLLASDIPNLDASKITTGTLPIARGGTGSSALNGNGFLTVNSGGVSLTSTVCSASEVPFFDGTNWICKLASAANSSATLVMRDNNGNFTANNITTVQDMTVQRNLRVQDGTVGGYIGLTTPVGISNYDIVLPGNGAPSIGQVLSAASGTTSATIFTTWVTALSDVLAPGNMFVGNASGTATSVAMTGDATLSNTGNLQLVGVGAAVTSGTEYTKVTVDGKGRVTSGSQLSNADVVAGLGYVPMNTVSSTSPITLTGGASNPVIGFEFSGVVSGAYGSNTLIPNFMIDAFGRITSATSVAYADATNVTKGIVQVGNNITVTAGVISITSGNVIAALGSLSGDVSGTLDNTVVMTVGGKTAAQISQSVSDTIDATHLNSSGTIVRRDNNGNFTANNITTVQDMTVQRNLRVQDGTVGGYIGLTTPVGISNYDIVLPGNGAPSIGQVLSAASGTTSSTVFTTWISALTDSLASGSIFVGNAAGIASGVVLTGDATMSNTGNMQLISVGAGVTSGTEYTKVTVDGKGRVVSGSQLNNADVTAGLGYVPMNSVSSTAPITISGGASNPIIGFENSGVVATTYGTNTLIPYFTVDMFGRITSAGSQVYADTTSGTKGIVQIGNNITLSTGVISITSANVIAAMGTLGGDVSGTLDNTVVMTVGGKTAAQISQSVSDTINATHLNSSGTIVRRDNDGNFTANNITTVQDMTVQRNLRVQNGLTNYIGITAPIASPSYDIILPNNSVAPTVGQVLSVASGSTGTVIATRWMNALTDVLAPGYIFVGNSSGTATGVAMTGDATMSNTGDFQLVSVGAGVTSGSQYTKVTVDGKGRVTSGAQLNNADVNAGLGYIAMNTVSATSPLSLSGGASNPVISLDVSGVTSATYPKVSVDVWGRVTSGSTLNVADVTTGLGYTPMNTVSSTSPITLTGGASNPTIGLAFSGVTSGTYPKVSVDLWGRVTSGSTLDFADVATGLGYSPVASVSSTSPIVITGTASNPVVGLANSGVVAATYGSDTLIPYFTVDAFGRISSAGSQVYADATSGTKGIVQIGSNITISTGTISITSANVIAAMGTLGGDVSGTLDNTIVMTVGGKTAAQISQSVSDTINATHLNSSSTIVRRDNNGDFTANNITTVQDMTVQRNLRVQNGMTNYIGITTPIATPSYDIVLPNNTVAPTVGQVLSVASGSTGTVIATRWINALTDVLTPGFIFVGNASGTATGVALTGDATISNTGNLQFVSVGAGVTSGTQYTKVTVDGKGRVTSGTQLNNADVVTALGYTPADDAVSGTYVRRANNLSDLTNSATARTNLGLGTFATADTVDLGSASATGIIADARLQDFAGVASGTQYTKVTVDGKGRVTSGAQLTNADVNTALGYIPMNSVSSTSPITLTGGASNPIIGLAFSGVVSGTYPKVSVDLWGRVTSGTVLDFTDVTTGLGYSPVASVSATSPLVLTGTASNPVISLANSGVIAGTYGSNTLIPFFTVDAFGRISSAGSQVYADATSGTKGIVQIGNNITLSTGVISITSANVIAAMGALGGDVSGTLDNTIVMTVGGKTAAQISQSVSDTINATHLNSSSTIVRRDNNGDFTANNITTVQDMTVQRNLRIQNGMTNYIGITTPIATPNYDIILPNNAVPPTVGQVLAVASGSTGTLIATRWYSTLTDMLSPGYIFVGSASGAATGMQVTGDATMSSSGSLQLTNVGANVTSGSQYTKLTVDGKGRVVSGGQLVALDVTTALGYTPADDAASGTFLRRANNLSDLTSSATARTNLGLGTFATADTVDLGSASATGIIADARLQDFAGVTSGTQYTKLTVDGKGRVTSGAQLVNADIVTALGFAPMSSVSSTSPITLTGGASNPTIGLAFSGVTSGTYPKVSVDLWGRVTNGSVLDFTDVTTGLGYSPVASVSATTPLVLTGTASNPVISLANSGVTSGTYPKVTVDIWGRVTSGSTLNVADITTGLGYTPMNSVTVSSPLSITGGASNPTISLDVSGVLAGTYPKVTVDIWGRITSGSNLAFTDITTGLGYTPMDDAVSGTFLRRANNLSDLASSATARTNLGLGTFATADFVDLGSASATGIIADARLQDFAGVVSGTQYTKLTVDGKGRVTSGAQLVNADIVAALGYLPMNSVSSTSPITLTGGASNPTIGLAFSGVVSATYPKVSVDLWGRVTSGSDLAFADVVTGLGYTPIGTVSATAPLVISGTASQAIIALANSGVTAGSYGSATLIPNFVVDAWGRITSATAQAYADATAGSKGIVQIGSNITLSAGTISVTSGNVIAAVGSLGGDVSGTLNATVVQTVGGKTAAQISQSVSDTITATHLNSSSTIVRRDNNGDFSANNITTVQDMTVQRNLRVQNGMTNYIGITTPIATPSYDIVLPSNAVAPTVGQVLAVASGSTGTIINTRWANVLTDMLASAHLYVGSASGSAVGVLLSGDATLSNTGVMTLSSVGANVTSGSQYTKVTVDGKGRVVSGAQLDSADVISALGYTPSGAVSAAAPLTLTGGASNSVIGMANSGVAAATYGASGTMPIITVDVFGRITAVASQSLRVADTVNTGVVSIGSNITVNAAGQISLTNSNVTSALGYTPVNLAGDTMTGGLTTPSLVVSNTIALGTATSNASAILDIASTTKGILIPRMTTTQRNAIASGATTDGLQIYNTSNKNFEYYDSAANEWKTILNNTGAVTSINGSASATQLFATGSAGTSFGVATVNGVHTFNFPMAATVGVTQGALTNTQYQSFVDKVTAVSGVMGQIVITGTTSAPVVGLANSGVTAGTFGSSATISVLTVDTFGRVTGVASEALRPASTTENGVVQVGSNISVTAGVISITSGNVITALGASLAGDVTGSISATVVATVGGKTSSQISQSVSDTINATSANSSGTIVRRDNNGNFVANNITTVQDMTVQRNLRIQNGLTNSIGIFTPIGTPNYDIILPDNNVVPPAGYALSIASATAGQVQTTWVPIMSAAIASGTMFVGNASGVATAVYMSGDATVSNLGNLQLASVGANVTSGSQYTKVTVDGKGRVVSGGQLSSTDVTAALGFTPGGVVSSTAPITLTGPASSPVIGLANSGVTVGTYGSSFTIPIVTVDAFGRLTTISSQTLRVADSVTTGVVSIGSNITVNGAGQISLTNSNVTSALGYTPVNRAGDTMTGLLTTPSLVVSNTVGIGTASVTAGAIFEISSIDKGILIPRMTTAQRGSVTTSNGIQIYNTDIGAFQYYDTLASAWKSIATDFSAVTSINGSASSTQTFTTGSAGTSFNIVTNNGNHTFNIPMASAVGVTQGAISNTQYQSFVDKVTSVSGIVGQIAITGTTSSPVVGLATTGVAAATYGTSFTIPIISVDTFGRLTLVSSQTLRVADSVNTGVVSIGSNITVNAAGQISLTSTNVTSALNYVPVNRAGDNMTGALTAPSIAVSNTIGIGTVTNNASAMLDIVSTTKGILIPRMTTAQRNLVAVDATRDGLQIYNTDNRAVEYYDGTAAVWKTLVSNYSAITSLNGSASSTQTFTTGSAGTSFNVVTSNGNHTFSIPMAANAGVTQGAITNTQYQSFVDKVTAVSGIVGQIAITGTTSSPVIGLANSGVTVGTYGSSFTIPIVTVDAFGRLTTISSQTLRVADSVTTGVVSIGSNITVNGAGQISLTNSNVTSALGYTPVNRAGDNMTGALTAPSIAVSNTIGIGTVTNNASAILDIVSTTKGILIPRMTTTERNAIASGATTDGLQIYNTSIKALEYYDSTAAVWKTLVSNYSAITSLNGSTSSTQTFTTGSAGTSFNIVTSNGGHTFNIPMAATAGVTQGAITNTQYQTFVDKVNTVSGVVGQIAITGTASSPVVGLANSGVTAGTYGSSFTIPIVSVDIYGRLTTISSQTLRLSASGVTGVVSIGSNITVNGAGQISLTNSNVTSALGYTPVNLAGDNMTGALTAPSIAVSNTIGIGTVTNNASAILDIVSTTKGILIPRMTTTQRNAIASGATTDGLQIYNTSNKALEYYDSTAAVWKTLVSNYSAVTSLNGSTSSTQTFAAANTGTAFGITTLNGVHTFAIPLAATASVTQGLLSNVQYQSFVDKVTSVTASAGQIVITGGTSSPVVGLATTGVTAATYSKVTVDIYGRITSGAVIVASDIPTMAGDVTGNIATNTVATVGGKTAVQISQSVSDTIAATSANTASTIVKRDGSGGFIAGDISHLFSIFRGSTAGVLTVRAPATTATYTLTLPASSGALGNLLQTDGAGTTSWIDPSAIGANCPADMTLIVGNSAIGHKSYCIDTVQNTSASLLDYDAANVATSAVTLCELEQKRLCSLGEIVRAKAQTPGIGGAVDLMTNQYFTKVAGGGLLGPATEISVVCWTSGGTNARVIKGINASPSGEYLCCR